MVAEKDKDKEQAKKNNQFIMCVVLTCKKFYLSQK